MLVLSIINDVASDVLLLVKVVSSFSNFSFFFNERIGNNIFRSQQ